MSCSADIKCKYVLGVKINLEIVLLNANDVLVVIVCESAMFVYIVELRRDYEYDV